MQGYIINTTAVKNEDVLVRILTPKAIKRLYRFYGARHSIVHIGKKIDFEEEGNGFFLPRLRNIMQLGYKWEGNLERVYIWQRFIRLLDAHLLDISQLDSFYFDMLEKGAQKLLRQNPLRVVLEMYAELLEFEGRNDRGEICFICGETLGQDVSLGRAFLFGHPHCIQAKIFQKASIVQFLSKKTAIDLQDYIVEEIWEILCKGF